MAELAPFRDGMQLGQGFNSFLQTTCLAKAVAVTDKKSSGYSIHYTSELIEDYEKLAKSLEITAGAAISGWGQSGSVEAGYLDRKAWETSTVTYEVKVVGTMQTSSDNDYSFNKIKTEDKHAAYGDRFICAFIQGGSFLGRISIEASSSSSTEEVKAAAKAACTMYGATGEISTEVKTAIETLEKKSHITINKIQYGGGARPKVFASQSGSASELEALKNEADKFYAELEEEKHNYKQYALLEKYTNIDNFDGYFKPNDYKEAKISSWGLFNVFTEYHAMASYIQEYELSRFIDDPKATKQHLQAEATKHIKKIEAQVDQISKDPSNANKIAPNDPEEFWAEVLKHLVTTNYVAERRTINKIQTDSIVKKLTPGATNLFTLKGYDFGPILRTTVVSFGRMTGDKDFGYFIGSRAKEFSNWHEDSYFWAFPKAVAGLKTQRIVFSRPLNKNIVRLHKYDADIDDDDADGCFVLV